ncbi:MAG: glycosyltransferase family 39 protein [Candidatus Solibacter sp.]
MALLLAGFYVATSLYISSRRLFWADEIYTVLLSRQPDLRTLWNALADGVDQVPVLYVLLARIFDQLFNHSALGVRVPSVLALGIGLLVTFDIVRRLTDALGGLIAMAFLSTSFVVYYGYEARPYALFYMLAAFSLWIWIFTPDNVKSAAAFGVVFFAGEMMHYYFLLGLLPYAIMALAQRRIFHPKVVAATAGLIAALGVLYPQIASSRAKVRGGVIYSWTPPSIAKLEDVYLEFFPHIVLVLVILAAVWACFGSARERLVPAMTAGERVSWLFVTIPFAAYVLGRLVTNFFYHRYMMGVVLGIVVAVTCLYWRYFRQSFSFSLTIFILLGAMGAAHQFKTLRNIGHIYVAAVGDSQQNTRDMLALEDTLQLEGKRHFALSSHQLFLTSWFYTKDRERYEFISSEVSLHLDKYERMKLGSIAGIAANPAEFAVINPDKDLLDGLRRAGLHLKKRHSEPDVFYVE